MRVCCIVGMTGPLVMDFKGDRIMDYQVWYLASDGDKFDGYMRIPLMKAARNATACTEWLVSNTNMTYLTYSRDDEDDVLALWQPIFRTVFLHMSLSVAI